MKKILSKIFYHLPVPWQIRIRKKVSLLYNMAGYGDTFMVGAVAREIKKKYGNILITVNGTREEVLKNNPNIDKTGQRYNGIDLNYHYGLYNAGLYFENNLIEVMCKKVGIKEPAHSVDIFLTKDEESYACVQIGNLKKPVITIQIASNSFDNRRKSWPVDYWNKLISMLINKNCTIIQLGGLGEQHIEGTYNLINKQDIRRSIAIVKESDLHIGIVSSLMYGAAAVDTPAIIIFGGFERYATHKYKNIYPFESYIKCSPCIQINKKIDKCPFNNQCMWEITPEMVFDKAIQILNDKL